MDTMQEWQKRVEGKIRKVILKLPTTNLGDRIHRMNVRIEWDRWYCLQVVKLTWRFNLAE